ncbi:hypothetical protein DL93DRAFT_1771407 [Clavulina sp. PMI_390]|nr:hypothetical protein DL93DRAFT_1771407 [Clavulina sp. PMI_390]
MSLGIHTCTIVLYIPSFDSSNPPPPPPIYFLEISLNMPVHPLVRLQRDAISRARREQLQTPLAESVDFSQSSQASNYQLPLSSTDASYSDMGPAPLFPVYQGPDDSNMKNEQKQVGYHAVKLARVWLTCFKQLEFLESLLPDYVAPTDPSIDWSTFAWNEPPLFDDSLSPIESMGVSSTSSSSSSYDSYLLSWQQSVAAFSPLSTSSSNLTSEAYSPLFETPDPLREHLVNSSSYFAVNSASNVNELGCSITPGEISQTQNYLYPAANTFVPGRF